MSIEDKKNRTQADKVKEFWKKSALTYWTYVPGERAALPAAFEAFYRAHRAGFRDVLDIGCGTGRFMIPMLQDGLNVTGLDITPEMREGAEANLEIAGDTLKGKALLVDGESKKLPFPDRSFDYVFAKGSIHHNTWPDIEQSVREAARVLRPRGFFLLQCRSPKDKALSRSKIVSDVGITAQDPNKEEADEHYFTKEELEQLARENGLEVVLGPEEIVKEEKGNARWWVVYRKIA